MKVIKLVNIHTDRESFIIQLPSGDWWLPMLKNYFKVYKNGNYITNMPDASLKSAKRFIKSGGVFIGTHMGEWKRAVNGYRYHTTTGATVEFVRFAKEVSNARY